MPKRPHPASSGKPENLESLLPDVTPIADHGRALPPRKKIAPVARQRLRDEQSALVESLSDHPQWDVGIETGEELVYLRDGLATDTLRKLRRGHWVIQDELDLHGHTTDEARSAVALFMQDCLREGFRCVRIVHGKGLRSKNREPVLKAKVGNWLRQREEVLAYCQARQADGGAGAVVVLLKAGTRR
jgi:DNA-nicking Smr family endonuclease